MDTTGVGVSMSMLSKIAWRFHTPCGVRAAKREPKATRGLALDDKCRGLMATRKLVVSHASAHRH